VPFAGFSCARSLRKASLTQRGFVCLGGVGGIKDAEIEIWVNEGGARRRREPLRALRVLAVVDGHAMIGTLLA
jgi:hypothetical protein